MSENKIIRLKYDQITFTHFKGKLSHPYKDFRILSDSNLSDGRNAMLYMEYHIHTGTSDGRTYSCKHTTFYIVIQEKVYRFHHLEDAVGFQWSIDNNTITKWRPELSGLYAGMYDYTPAYVVNYDSAYMNRFIKDLPLTKPPVEFCLYRSELYLTQDSGKCYMRLHDKFYIFQTVEDCLKVCLQIKHLQEGHAPAAEYTGPSLETCIKKITNRANVHLSAQKDYKSISEAFSVTDKGALMGSEVTR